ncbi:hypothetical protein WK55_22155 [Burkholderia ubonensis]|uniref:DUF2827 family protein n=1 Tax=Burkholderia ubonensis TaxID=101571 RepID=UPI00075411C4|nr:DUF2827 family protein [Burkholderia ubonensis]KVT54039.1 hypothetical protein WK55_22155 [Burkholderia ubonensis]
MRIGISLLTQGDPNLWANGLSQNVVFLADLVQRLPFVDAVTLIEVGDPARSAPQPDRTFCGMPLVTIDEATDHVDVIVEMSGALDVKWLDWMRARGKKVVYHCCGQPYAALAERPLFGCPGPVTRPDRCDEVWILPKDAAFAPMLRTVHRCDVHEVPFIWHPRFIRARMAEVRQQGFEYSYTARKASRDGFGAGLHVAIFEPNISVVKNATLPMLICDEAYRTDPDSVAFMCVMNMRHVKDHPTTQHFTLSLELFRHRKVAFYARHDIVSVMAQRPNAVVSHQWQNDQNYLYLDVLYGDYPLIHNSPWLKDVGYYYPDFDLLQGAAALRRAAADHDQMLDDYRMRAQRVFEGVNPFAQHNLDRYAERLLHLCRDATFVRRTGLA